MSNVFSLSNESAREARRNDFSQVEHLIFFLFALSCTLSWAKNACEATFEHPL